MKTHRDELNNMSNEELAETIFDLIIKAKKELDEICTHDNYVKAREQYKEQVKQSKVIPWEEIEKK